MWATRRAHRDSPVYQGVLTLENDTITPNIKFSKPNLKSE